MLPNFRVRDAFLMSPSRKMSLYCFSTYFRLIPRTRNHLHQMTSYLLIISLFLLNLNSSSGFICSSSATRQEKSVECIDDAEICTWNGTLKDDGKWESITHGRPVCQRKTKEATCENKCQVNGTRVSCCATGKWHFFDPQQFHCLSQNRAIVT